MSQNGIGNIHMDINFTTIYVCIQFSSSILVLCTYKYMFYVICVFRCLVFIMLLLPAQTKQSKYKNENKKY